MMDSKAQRIAPVMEPQAEPEPNYRLELLAPSPQKSVIDYLQLLWEERRLLLRFAGRGLVLFIVLAVLMPPRYESVTRLMPPETQNSSGMAMLAALAGQGGDALDGFVGSSLGVKSSGALFVGILRSRTVEDALVRRFDLRGVYWVQRWEDARQELESRSYISEDRKSGIIEVRVRDRRPERSQALARAYVEELDRAVATLSTSAARREREFLETRLQAVKQDLDQAAMDFSQFASKNTAINIPEQGKAMVEAAARLQGELIAAEAERQGLEQIYTGNNVRVRAVQGRIRELREQLKQLRGADLEPGNPNPDHSLYPSIRKLPILGVTYADLYRRTKIEEALFETLTKQYELAKVQEAKEIPAVKVLDEPSYPERRVSPSRLLVILIGLGLSFVAGAAWILGNAKWNATPVADPRKALLTEVSFTSGRRLSAWGQYVRARLRRRQEVERG